MACYHPIPAYKDAAGKITLVGGALHTIHNLELPCGKCIGCTTSRALQWAHRCAHEAKKFQTNIFLTLTYDDDNLPQGGHLSPRHLQLFLKRLRQDAKRHPERHLSDPTHTIRYFACGEYGHHNKRPHYHLILFNTGFPDAVKCGTDLYESTTLSEVWKYGKAAYGAATPKSANYVAQYQLKKQHAPPGLTTPFLRMSNRPAIGTDWLEQYKTDLRHGYLVESNRKYPIPRTYKRKLKKSDPQLYEEITTRTQQQYTNRTTETEAQLHAHERIHERQQELAHHRDL